MFSGGAMRRWGASLALGLALTAAAAANPDDAARKFPASSELFIAGKVLPGPEVTRDLLLRAEANPALELLLDQIPRAAYLSVREDILPLVEGHIALAWVRTGEKSPYDAVERREFQESAYTYLTTQLKELGVAVSGFKAKRKRWPKDLTEATGNKSSTTSTQADIKLVKTAQGWSIVTVYKGTLGLQEIADAPSYVFGKGLVESKRKLRPATNLIVSFQCADVALARKALAKLTDSKMVTATDAEHWQLPVDEMTPWTIQIVSGWVVASDNPELLKQYASSAQPNLTSNPHYLTQRQLLPASSDENAIFGFFDIDDLVRTTTSFADLPPISKIFGSIGAVEKYTATGASELPSSSFSEVFVETQLSVMNVTAAAPVNGTVAVATTAPAGELKASLSASNATVSNWSFLDAVPAQSSIVYAINVGEGLRLLELAGKLDPDVEKLWGSLYAQGLKALGIEATASEVNRSTGWLVVETEILDQIFSMTAEVRRAVTNPTEAPDSGVAVMISQLAKLPAHWSLQFSNPALEDRVAHSLWKSLGDAGLSQSVGPLTYWMRADGTAAVAQLPISSAGAPGRVAVTGKVSKRLFLRSLDVAAGKRESLTALDTLQDFRSRVHGRPVFFTHQKIDWIYSIIKGILLAFDSQSRPEAEVLGQYRDTYAAVSVEPRGIRGFAALYSSEKPMRLGASGPVDSNYQKIHDQMANQFQERKNLPADGKNGEGGLSAFGNARAQGQLTACKSNLKNLATACEMYASDNSGLYPLSLNKLTPNYLKKIPICPTAEKDTYSAHYKHGAKPDSFSIYCWGYNHAACKVPANRPAYNSKTGLVEK